MEGVTAGPEYRSINHNKNDKELQIPINCIFYYSSVPSVKRGGGWRIKFCFWTHVYRELQQN